MQGPEAKKKLLDPSVCRVFFSSPFNGMEEEREELTRKYWPRLQSACSGVGVTFVPVDMRWGITSEQSTNAQTINICLQEIDRSVSCRHRHVQKFPLPCGSIYGNVVIMG